LPVKLYFGCISAKTTISLTRRVAFLILAANLAANREMSFPMDEPLISLQEGL
jgi:hypothetical protein